MKNLLAGKKIVEKRLIWFLIPVAIVLIACIFFGIYAGVNKSASEGFNVGIDFTGGSMVTVDLGQDSIDNFDEHVKKIEAVLAKYNVKIGAKQTSGTGSEASVVIRYSLASNDADKNIEINNNIEKDLVETYSDVAGDRTIVRIKTIGATASNDLILTALLSVLISTLLILLYIVIRFRNIFTGIAAVSALLHDVVMVICFTLIFRIQINSSFIAAIITVIAYSINNTIVIFDRIRGNKIEIDDKMPLNTRLKTINKCVNKSIAQTITRSINTTITTLFAIVILAIIGVPSIKEFALPVIFGLLAGTFSSVFFATSLFSTMKGAYEKNKFKPKKVKKVKTA